MYIGMKFLPRASLVNSLIVLKLDAALLLTARTHATHFAHCAQGLVHFMLNNLKENSYTVQLYYNPGKSFSVNHAFSPLYC